MICCYLLHSGAMDGFPGNSPPDNALAYFASRRTDRARGRTYQGVQTPSQARFIRYYSAMLSSSLLKRQIREDPPVFVIESARIVNAVVPESIREKAKRETAPASRGSGSFAPLEYGKDGVPGSVFTMLVYDGMNAVRLRKTQPGISGVEAGTGERQDTDHEQNGKDTAKPIATIPTRSTRHGKYGTFEFDVDALPSPACVRGDVKIRVLSPWQLPGKKYDDCFVYFWFHTSFLRGRDDEDSFAASIAEANMPASGSVAGDGGVPSVGTSDVREDPEDPEHGVILTLCRDRLDNGHHRANRRALPENFAVEIKFRRVPSGGHHGLGSYQPKLFDPLRGKAGSGSSSEKKESESENILSMKSPWSRER